MSEWTHFEVWIKHDPDQQSYAINLADMLFEFVNDACVDLGLDPHISISGGEPPPELEDE